MGRTRNTTEPWGRGSGSRDQWQGESRGTGPQTPQARAEERCLVVRGPEARGRAAGCWAAKASPSTAESWCFLEQTPSTAGRPLCWGGPSGCIPLGDLSSGTHLHALPLLWEVLGIWQLPRSTLPLNPALPPLPSQLLGFPVYGSSSPSPDLPKGAVMISSTRTLG